ncbi:MAG: DUF2070 family protein [Nitrososphaerota archaeon]|nr:DUF2070 family protein [Nitrososphaerota archaeon]
MQKVNQNVGHAIRTTFRLPTNPYVLPILHFVLLFVFQLLLLTYIHGSFYLIPLSFAFAIIYIFGARAVASKIISYATLRRVAATHSFFLVLAIIDIFIFKILNLNYVSFISSLAVVFSFSLLVIRGEFFRSVYVSFAMLLIYFIIFLFPSWQVLALNVNTTVIIFWIVVTIISLWFYGTMNEITRKLIGADVVEITQSALDAWMTGYSKGFEDILERNSTEIVARTYVFDFYFKDRTKACLVIPPIHPGPFKWVGSSSLPEKLSNLMLKKGYSDCIVFHSLSNHDMNLPSNAELEKYINYIGGEPSSKLQLTNLNVFKNEGQYFRCLGFDSDQSTLGITVPKQPMDDFPFGFTSKALLESGKAGKELVLIDAHNRLATKFGDINYDEVFKECSSSKNEGSPSLYVQFERIDAEIPEIAGAGIHKLTISDLHETIKLLCADSNNSLPEATDTIEKGLGMVLVTSDTHQTSTFMNSKGYWAFGDLTDANYIIKTLEHRATDRLMEAQVYLNMWDTKIKVMGSEGVTKLKNSMKLAMGRFRIYMIALLCMYIVSLLIK